MNELTPRFELEKVKNSKFFRKIFNSMAIVGIALVPTLLISDYYEDGSTTISQLTDQETATEDISSSPETTNAVVKENANNLLINYMEMDIPDGIDNETINLLNSQETNDSDYLNILLTWNHEIPIFRVLSSKESKIRFITAILEIDNLDQNPYTSIDYGPDLNGNGVIDITSGEDGISYNEAGEPIDVESFTCDDFSRELSIRIGIQNGSPLNLKFQLPMMRAELSSRYSIMDDGIFSGGKGHSFNSVFLGDNIEGISRLSNWFFIEPQTDNVVDIAPALEYRPLLTLSIQHDDIWDKNGDTLISFFLNQDGTLQPVNESQLQIIGEIESWVFMNISILSANPELPDDSVSDEPQLTDFQSEDIYSIAEYVLVANYFSYSQLLKALDDAYLPQDFDQSALLSRIERFR